MYSKRCKLIWLSIAVILLATAVHAWSNLGDTRPVLDSTYSLGQLNRRWLDVFAVHFHGSGGNLTDVPTYNSSYDSKPDNTYNATYDAYNTYNETYDEFTQWSNATAGSKLGDNIRLYLGDDDDVCMYWDGTSFIITSTC